MALYLCYIDESINAVAKIIPCTVECQNFMIDPIYI